MHSFVVSPIGFVLVQVDYAAPKQGSFDCLMLESYVIYCGLSPLLAKVWIDAIADGIYSVILKIRYIIFV